MLLSRPHRSTLRLLVVLALSVVAACKGTKANDAAREVRAGTQRVSVALKKLMAEYPRLETEIDPLRSAKPAQAADRIRKEIVPLFDDVARTLEAAAVAEENYVAVATGDAAAIEGIKKNAAVHHRQAASYGAARDTYTKEAALLDAGPVPDADARALIQTRVAALNAMN